MFELLSNLLRIAQKNPAFDQIYNDIKVQQIIWYFCMAIIGLAVVFGFRRGTANKSFKPNPLRGSA